MSIDIRKLDKLASDRHLIPSHVFAFLESMSHVFKVYLLLREMAKIPPQKVSYSAEFALMQAIVFSVRALETLMRDCFVSCMRESKSFKEHVLENDKSSLRLSDIHNLVERPHHFDEYLASLRNFQSLDVVNAAFYSLYEKDFLSIIDEFNAPIFRHEGKLTLRGFSMKDYSPSWKSDLYKLYQERHEIVHNGHHQLRYSVTECQNMIDAALIAGQVAGIVIGSAIGDENTPKAGTVMVEAPIAEVMTWYLVARNTDLHFEEVKKKADEILGVGSMGAIGPFMFLWTDLLKTDFSDRDNGESKPGRNAHIVRILESGKLKIDTLYEIQDRA